jgi:arylsulfatase A-like enzyme
VVFSEYLENEEAMARSERYKLIVGTGRRVRQDGYKTDHPLPGPYEHLFDLRADPGETTDLATRPELAGIKDELRRRLHDRPVSTRGGLEPVPAGLAEIEAIHWCLVPRDR